MGVGFWVKRHDKRAHTKNLPIGKFCRYKNEFSMLGSTRGLSCHIPPKRNPLSSFGRESRFQSLNRTIPLEAPSIPALPHGRARLTVSAARRFAYGGTVEAPRVIRPVRPIPIPNPGPLWLRSRNTRSSVRANRGPACAPSVKAQVDLRKPFSTRKSVVFCLQSVVVPGQG